MKLYTVIMVYCNMKVLLNGLQSYESTATEESEIVLVSHKYPLWKTEDKKAFIDIAEYFDCTVIEPYRNLGGHGGASWAFEQLPLEDDDIIIGADPDMQFVTPGWDTAAIKGLALDTKLGAVSLMPDYLQMARPWQLSSTEPRLAVLPPCDGMVEMINITVWKASFLKQIGGLTGGYPFYGNTEVDLFHKCKEHGMYMAYLYDVLETKCKVPHDEEYSVWKLAHIQGYKGNFCDWLKESTNAEHT